MRTFKNRTPQFIAHPAFTLIELLVVISIMGVLAAFTIPVIRAISDGQKKKVARAELERIGMALESYKAKYGVYPPSNQNANSGYTSKGQDRSQFSQLYYELSGTTRSGNTFTTLDGAESITESDFNKAYGVSGNVNTTTPGAAEDSVAAQNFLPGLKPNQYNSNITNSDVRTTELITSVGGPDQTYQPLGPNSSGINPFRYIYPGTNNPNSYDLWVQLVIRGKTNLICNWSKQPIINSPLP
jgi:prepilin-type N-terminal cleavage/methylation domain-containing protein